MKTIAITTTAFHGYDIGDRTYLTMIEPDMRRWRRLLFWLLGRSSPTREVMYRAVVESATRLSIEGVAHDAD